jgi:hypothetical protein
MKYCNNNCLARGPILIVAKGVPDHLVKAEAERIFKSPCPVCKQAGPTEIHFAHNIWSALVVTSWNSSARFSCKACGVKQQSLAAAKSLLLGWWGFPWGILGTPVTVLRNVWGMSRHIGASQPSKALLSQTRAMLAAESIAQSRRA